jgi:glutaredoxin
MRKLLFILLIASIILFSLDRLAAHLYMPKENSNIVVIYTTKWCPYCEALRGTLDRYQIPYTEHDTEKSLHGFAGYWALRGRGVPISVIGSEVIHGYDGQVITDALISTGYTIPTEWPSDEQE